MMIFFYCILCIIEKYSDMIFFFNDKWPTPCITESFYTRSHADQIQFVSAVIERAQTSKIAFFSLLLIQCEICGSL